MWPFLGPLVVDPNDPNTAYQAAPFVNPSDWPGHVTSGNLAALVSNGFDHVRLPVVPGPWMDALRDGDETRIEYLFGLFDVAVNACLAAGLHVVIDLHDSYYVRNTPTELLAGGTSTTIWIRRVEITRRFAVRYSGKSPQVLALELFNEPLPNVSIAGDWKDYQDTLYAVARPAMPNHTLCLTGDYYSNIAGLVATNPSLYDKNVLWVIHPYIPAIFANQGYANGYNNWVTGLKWPPTPADKSAAITAMTASVNADSSLSAGQKTATIASQTTELGFFFDTPLDKVWINNEYQKAVQWCATNGIPVSRVWISEVGVTRTNTGYAGAATASRRLYMTDQMTMIKARGFRYSIFALDAVDYGVTDGTGSTIGTLDAVLIT